MEAADFDVAATAANQVERFRAAQVAVRGSRCYFAVPSEPGDIAPDRVHAGVPTARVLYEYDISSADADAAQALGFRGDYSKQRFASQAVSCITPPDTEQVDTPAIGK